jgi:hypothetical protein
MAIPKGTNTNIRVTKAIFTFIILPPGEIYVRIAFIPLSVTSSRKTHPLVAEAKIKIQLPSFVEGNQAR